MIKYSFAFWGWFHEGFPVSDGLWSMDKEGTFRVPLNYRSRVKRFTNKFLNLFVRLNPYEKEDEEEKDVQFVII